MGGVESYLNELIPALYAAGNQVAFCYETDESTDREQIALPEGVESWCVTELGAGRALELLRDWRPDVIFTQRLVNAEFENETLRIAPAIFFSHDYNGMCISGGKAFKSPTPKPCTRTFGWQCLFHYYPHRCGGLSPLTMLKEYERQSKRQKLLREYKAVVTNSMHMQAELSNHGLASRCVYLPVTNGFTVTSAQTSPHWRLLFLGRMDFLKGGHLLLEALPEVCASLKKPVQVTFAGDGPERERWQHLAAEVQARTKNLTIEFVGWQNETKRDALLNDCDLLVVPSLWPEPFGMVGPEAGLHGLPVAAFASGGIQEWLTDGSNGYIAYGDHPTAKGLAEAIIKCLHDSATHTRLRQGAKDAAWRFNMKNHLAALLQVFEEVVGSSLELQ